MVKVQNFNEGLEQDFSRLTAEIKEQRALAEEKKEKITERVIVKRSLEAITATVVPPPVSVPSTPVQKVPSTLPDYTEGIDERVKTEIRDLINLVLKEDLGKALIEVRRHPPFVQDAFHDALVDKLFPELERRGIVT